MVSERAGVVADGADALRGRGPDTHIGVALSDDEAETPYIVILQQSGKRLLRSLLRYIIVVGAVVAAR